MFLTVRGLTYHYYVHSRNAMVPNLVMLHGFMGDSGIFDHLIEKLVPFCNPVAIDLIGHGQTDAPPDPERYNVDEQIADLTDLLGQLQLPELYMLGYSMGGRLALRLALSAPFRIHGLILESVTYGIVDTEERRRRRETDRQRAGQIQKSFRGFVDNWNTNPLFLASRPVPEHRSRALDAIQRRQRPHGLANSLIGFGSGRLRPVHQELPALTTPALLISGEDDQRYTRLGREMNRLIPASRHVIVPASGHRVHIDQPGSYLSIIQKFIESQQTVSI